MDIKAKINELVSKITGDDGLLAKFKKDPKGTVQSVAGELPDDAIDGVIAAIKAKIGDNSAIGGLLDKAQGLFDKD